MRARLPSSRKWTQIPKELAQQIKSVFKQTFQQHIGKGSVEADGRIYTEEIVISVGVKLPGSTLKQSNWLVSIAYTRGKDDVVKLLNLAVDAAGSLFEQLFTSENDYDFPRVWQEVDFEGRKIHVQYTTENTELESAADQLLGVTAEDKLTGGDWEEEAENEEELIASIKQKLGVDGDEDESDEPSVAGKPPRKKPPTH